MGRLITIGLILLGILALSLGGIWYAGQTRAQMDTLIEQAIEAATAKKQEELLRLTDSLQQLWEGRETFLSFYVRHDEIEKMNTELVSLRSFAEISAYDSAYAVLYQMKFMSGHIYEREIPNLDNLL